MKNLSKSAVAVTVILLSFTVCKRNIAPDKPTTPSGPSIGSINVSYQFSSTATDPDGDSIAIRFSWGDGDTSDWSALVPSGDTVTLSHFWQTAGTYNIQAQARDAKGILSPWSEAHQIAIISVWQKTFGGLDCDCGYSVQQTSDGGYIIAGFTMSFGADDWDVYLIKTDANGNLLWERTFGGENDDRGYSVQETKYGGYIIVGETYSYGGWSNVYLIKTDANGNQQWQKTFGGSYWDEGCSVQQTSDGGYIIAGRTRSYGAGYYDVYLIKTDANGNQQWQKTFGGLYWDEGCSVQQTSDGGYIIAGGTEYDVYLIKTDANGNLLWERTFGGENDDWGCSVQQTSDGGYIIAGFTMSFGAGDWDVYLIKTDGNGNLLWERTFGGENDDRGYSVQQTSDEGYIIAGYTWSFGAGRADVYLIKTDDNGNPLWQKTFGGSSWDDGFSIQQTLDGGFIIAGSTGSFGAGNCDVYLIKTDSEGNTVSR
ncbi:MAG: PKD domain-containing protein [candidate division WOR-3 bacterium]